MRKALVQSGGEGERELAPRVRNGYNCVVYGDHSVEPESKPEERKRRRDGEPVANRIGFRSFWYS